MPVYNPFNGVTGKHSATLFEIRLAAYLAVHYVPELILLNRLETDVITLRGTESEASSQLLRGVVVLCLPASLRTEDVHLRMTGIARVG